MSFCLALVRLVVPADDGADHRSGDDAMPVPHRRVNVSVLREVLAAIRASASVEIRYQSMNKERPEPIWRRITPHAFGSDGFRWHARVFCHIDHKFKDFILSRILGVRGQGEPGELGGQNNQWNDFFEVILAPNPRLVENQQKVIAQDYEMQDGDIRIKVRRALLYYFRKRLRLDVAAVLDDPREVPLVVTNQSEFEAAIEDKGAWKERFRKTLETKPESKEKSEREG